MHLWLTLRNQSKIKEIMIHAGHLHKVVNLYGSDQAMLRSTEPFPILREIGIQYKRDNKVGQSG